MKKKEFTLKGHSSSVNSVAISKDGKFLVSGSHDQTIKVWNVEEKKKNLLWKVILIS